MGPKKVQQKTTSSGPRSGAVRSWAPHPQRGQSEEVEVVTEGAGHELYGHTRLAPQAKGEDIL